MFYLRNFTLLNLLIVVLSAGSINGTIFDSSTGKPVAGANIWVRDDHTGTSSDGEGVFQIPGLKDGSYDLICTHIGYQSRTIRIVVAGETNIRIQLLSTVIRLSDVTVTGTVATRGNNPLTFSTLNDDAIPTTESHGDVPQLMTAIPGVYSMTDGGMGLGDSHLMIRGFDEKRLQIMVNNIPVNDPETRDINWAYWGMLSGSAQAVQIQRGVGASLYGSGALGGLVNIITRDSPVEGNITANTGIGQHGLRRFGVDFHSGLTARKTSFTASLQRVQGDGWRDNTGYQGFYYYLSSRILPSLDHTIKLVLHGSPMVRALGRSTANVAAYADPDRFNSTSSIEGGSGRLNGWYQYAYGFGRTYNSNLHVPSSELTGEQHREAVSLMDAFLMNASLDRAPADQASGWLINGDRVSLNNHYSHRPQLEVHHNWRISHGTKLTSTAFVSVGKDWQDYVYPGWFIPRDSMGNISLVGIENAAFWGGDQVFGYRDVHSFAQTGLLSTLERTVHRHRFSFGFESRYWHARHGGMVFNTFGKAAVPVPIASVSHQMTEGDRFYDFTTVKPQVTLFGHGLWQAGPFSIMTNLQYTTMHFSVRENVPSNKNYPYQIDGDADSHGDRTWHHTGTIDHDGDPATVEIAAEYFLWDYSRSFQYLTPRIGISYGLGEMTLYANLSQGVKEPEIRHFFGFGAPREDIDLEKTRDTELGLRWNGNNESLYWNVDLAAYRILFAGKLMEITIPEKANQPGYDYAGHIYVPVGDALYTGLEASGNLRWSSGWHLSLSGTLLRNTWGEPAYSEGAQKLYGNVAVAGIDYQDIDGDGQWDEGVLEPALHSSFVKKYGRRNDVGMPGLMFNGRVEKRWDSRSAGIGFRFLDYIYVMEDNSRILTGAGEDQIFGTPDDDYAAILPQVWLIELSMQQEIQIASINLNISLRVKNLLDAEWWQRGDDYGVLPGMPRTVIMALELK